MMKMWLGPREIRYCKYYAELAEIGGRSEVRQGNRQKTLSVDQFVGMLGQYAFSLYLTGSPQPFYSQRLVANANPTVGDNGQDILGANLDVKTSLMRNSQDPMTYSLVIRPKEIHKDHVYVLALVEPNDESALKLSIPLAVYLVGWAFQPELPDKTENDGVFKGAYVVPAKNLHQMIPLYWDWREYDERNGTDSRTG